MNKRLWKRLLLISVIAVLSFVFIINPIATVIVYETIFSTRYETADWMAFSVDDFDGLTVEHHRITTDGQATLAGYGYKKGDVSKKGVVVLAHGMGGGGHNTYMPLIDEFASGGYAVFAYDATGNDNSDGNDIEGLPQGVIDLDRVLSYVSETEEYRDLPIMLFGHSWGAYAVGNVLNFHPEVQAAVIVAGFNESEDMILYQGRQYVGVLADWQLPYISLYEWLKFGDRFTSVSAVDGMAQSKADIMVIHSTDDTTVPASFGYDTFYKAFSDNRRFEFVLYEDRGHSYLCYSDSASAYREQLNSDYSAYIAANGNVYNEEHKTAFMNEHLDKAQCFDPDPALMEKILAMYDRCC